MKKNGWMIENTIIVHKSVRTTFFETIGFGGGYAGLQQHESSTCGKNKGNLPPIFDYMRVYIKVSVELSRVI